MLLELVGINWLPMRNLAWQKIGSSRRDLNIEGRDLADEVTRNIKTSKRKSHPNGPLIFH